MPDSPRMRVVWRWFAAVMFLYVTACVFPAIDFGSGGPADLAKGTKSGFFALAFGWINLLFVVFVPTSLAQKLTTITWLANPLGLIGLIFLTLRRPAVTVTLGALAVGLGICYLFYPYEQKRMVGAYLWVGSMVLLTAGGVSVWAAQRQPTTRRTVKNPPPQNHPSLTVECH